MSSLNSAELLRALPEDVRLRVRLLGGGDLSRPGAQFVLYVMRYALRAHENPALDAAVAAANALGLAVLVYQELSPAEPYASDRLHTFVLQGARDVAAELAGRKIRHALHVIRRSHPHSHLPELAARSALIVTEDMPVDPDRAHAAALGEHGCPAWAVDAACVLPMKSYSATYDRAYEFREAARKEHARRVPAAYAEVSPIVAWPDISLPLAPVDAGRLDIPGLVADCDIDHTIGPVPHTVGGSLAGYARWEAFVRRSLKRYASDRNDAALPGVSRMSAYLHYGMVSPFRIAREAHQAGGEGAEKFLDELQTWRELAYHWCAHQRTHESLDVLPAWARATLLQHAADPRPAVFSWETLARARTGDALWDAAQRSLLIHGELHNNVRMTWGKALLHWTRGPAEALRLIIDLNHRYALDGRDPASYGGILWCLGLFDRPHEPAVAVTGTVRARPLHEHARRLDLARYSGRTARPLRDDLPAVAVIGAGLAGAMAARTLADHGLRVTVFDKGRGPGGRLSTRRLEPMPGAPAMSFDHGAQYFTVKDARFVRYVRSWQADGIVAPWEGHIVDLRPGGRAETDDGGGSVPLVPAAPRTSATQREAMRYVGVPGMNAVLRHVTQSLAVRWDTAVASIGAQGRRWALADEAGKELGAYDQVVVAVPAPQAARLIAGNSAALAAAAGSAVLEPCWSLMIALPHDMEADFDAAFVGEPSPLSWVCRQGSKPQRGRGAAWVAHASAAWSIANLERPAEDVAAELAAAFFVALDRPPVVPVVCVAHRWRYASVSKAVGRPAMTDGGLTICGDWLLANRVEAAFLSGCSAAGMVLGAALPESVPAVEPTLFP